MTSFDDLLNDVNAEYRPQPKSAPAGDGSGDMTALIRQAAEQEGVGEYAPLLVRLAQTESGLNPRAQNPKSSAGGLFQFIDDTAQRYGIADKFDPAQNARAAARMFRDNLERFGGDVRLALAAHHVGPGKARQALADRSVGDVDISTQDWLARVTGERAPQAQPLRLSRESDEFLADGTAAIERRDRQEASDASPMSTNLARGWQQATNAVGNYFSLLAGDEQAIIERLQNWQEYDQANPQPTKTREFMQDWQDERHLAALTNLPGLAGGMVEQLANSLPAMAGSIPGMLLGAKAGAPLGPLGVLLGAGVGGAVGSAPGSVAIETGARLPAMMAEDGVDIADAGAVTAWLNENRSRVIEEGAKKGLTVASLGGLASGIGSAIIAKPALRFAQAEARIARHLGANAADARAIAAVRATPQYQAAIAPFKAELTAASTAAQNAMRGFASFASGTAGEIGGEYFGEVAATGEGDWNEALLEGVMAGGQSAVTTGAQFAGKQLMGIGRAQQQEQPAAPQPPQPQPNSPLSNAAAQAAHAAQALPPTPHANNAPVQPGMGVVPAGEAQAEPSGFDQRLARVASFVEDRSFIQSLRGAAEYGPESVTELLSAFVKARNPNVDDLVRERALADLEQFIDAFASRPNFTFGQADGAATDAAAPSTAVAAPTTTELAPATAADDGLTLDGEAREVGALPRQMLAAPDSIEAAEQMREAAEIAHERALLDLREAEQSGAPNIEAYRQAAEEAAAQRERIAAQLAEMQRTLEQTQRLQAEQERRTQFEALTRDAPPADAASRIAEVKRLVADGWRVEGKALVSPHGEQRSLNPVELAAAREAVRKAQAAEQSSPAGERIAGPTPEQSGVSSATQAPTAPEQSRPAPGKPSEPAQMLSGSGSYRDGAGWVASYDALPRSDGSTLLTRTIRDEDGERTEYLSVDGTWEKGKPSTVVVSGFAAVGGPESFPSADHALKAAQDDLAGMGGRRSEPAQPYTVDSFFAPDGKKRFFILDQNRNVVEEFHGATAERRARARAKALNEQSVEPAQPEQAECNHPI